MAFSYRPFTLILSAALAATLFLSGAPRSSARAQGPKDKDGTNGYVLSMKDRILGRLVYYARGGDGKMLSPNFCFIVRAGSPKITIYSDQTRRIWTCAYPEFKQKSRVLFSWRISKNQSLFPMSSWKKGKTETLCGLKATRFTRTWRSNKPPPNDESYTEEQWSVPGIQMANIAMQTFTNLLKAELAYGVPVKFTREWTNSRLGHKFYVDYEIAGFQRKHLTDDDFKAPTGYTPVKDEMTLLMDTQDLPAIDRKFIDNYNRGKLKP